MNLSPVERLLIATTLLAILYRTAKDRWPIALEIEPSPEDA